MKMLSIDVGIKNLACVVLNFNETEFVSSTILKWEVIDLTDRLLCETDCCNEIGMFEDKENCVLCRKHAKAKTKMGGNSLAIPTTHDKLKNIRKLKLPELRIYANSHGIDCEKVKKQDLLNNVEEVIKNKYYRDIQSSRADEYDLITLGRKLKIKMDVFMENTDIDIVCIENQISHLANRMKTLQGMITQYFIMSSVCDIEFVSSMNKLKELNLESSSYSERKKESIILCRKKISDHNSSWSDVFEKSKKKDDLSDCYLQGLCCIKKIREKLNIKIK